MTVSNLTEQNIIMYPRFFIVGAQKSGTTTLHDILSKHPEIGLPKYKETKFFLDDERFKKGINYYISHFFSKQSKDLIYGEIDPDYLYFEHVPQRIYSVCGSDTKIIILLRNPILRAYSHYQMSMRRGVENLAFIEAIEKEESRLKSGLYEKNHFSYIDRGRYHNQIIRYYSIFKKENIKVYIFDNSIAHNLDKSILEIINFIGVENNICLNYNIKSNESHSPIFKSLSKYLIRKNKSYSLFRYLIPNKAIRTYLSIKLDKLNRIKQKKKKTELDESTVKHIYLNYYKDEITSLEKLLNINLDIWKPL